MTEEYKDQVTSDVNEHEADAPVSESDEKRESQMDMIRYYARKLRDILDDEEKWYLDVKMPTLNVYGYTLTQSLGNIHRMQEKCNGIQRELIEYESNLKEAEDK